MSTTVDGALRKLTQRQATEAALHNERLTRQRVEDLDRRAEAKVRELEQLRDAFGTHVHLGFWGRLRWLLLGKR
jgi:hypothetical protein